MSFDTLRKTELFTMMGVKPSTLLSFATENRLFGYGANCGRGLEGAYDLMQALRGEGPSILVAKLNAGLPELVGGRTVYHCSPEQMGDYARQMRMQGARIIGACCGSNPKHIEAIANALLSS